MRRCRLAVWRSSSAIRGPRKYSSRPCWDASAKMAFWCFGGAAAQQLDAALREPGAVAETVQGRSSVFGSASSPAAWSVNGGSVRWPSRLRMAGRRVRAASNWWRFRTASRWRPSRDGIPRGRATLAALSKMTGMDGEALAERLSQRAEEAASIAAGYGASEAARKIPGKVWLPLEQGEGAGGHPARIRCSSSASCVSSRSSSARTARSTM